MPMCTVLRKSFHVLRQEHASPERKEVSIWLSTLRFQTSVFNFLRTSETCFPIKTLISINNSNLRIFWLYPEKKFCFLWDVHALKKIFCHLLTHIEITNISILFVFEPKKLVFLTPNFIKITNSCSRLFLRFVDTNRNFKR